MSLFYHHHFTQCWRRFLSSDPDEAMINIWPFVYQWCIVQIESLISVMQQRNTSPVDHVGSVVGVLMEDMSGDSDLYVLNTEEKELFLLCVDCIIPLLISTYEWVDYVDQKTEVDYVELSQRLSKALDFILSHGKDCLTSVQHERVLTLGKLQGPFECVNPYGPESGDNIFPNSLNLSLLTLTHMNRKVILRRVTAHQFPQQLLRRLVLG